MREGGGGGGGGSRSRTAKLQIQEGEHICRGQIPVPERDHAPKPPNVHTSKTKHLLSPTSVNESAPPPRITFLGPSRSSARRGTNHLYSDVCESNNLSTVHGGIFWPILWRNAPDQWPNLLNFVLVISVPRCPDGRALLEDREAAGENEKFVACISLIGTRPSKVDSTSSLKSSKSSSAVANESISRSKAARHAPSCPPVTMCLRAVLLSRVFLEQRSRQGSAL